MYWGILSSEGHDIIIQWFPLWQTWNRRVNIRWALTETFVCSKPKHLSECSILQTNSPVPCQVQHFLSSIPSLSPSFAHTVSSYSCMLHIFLCVHSRSCNYNPQLLSGIWSLWWQLPTPQIGSWIASPHLAIANHKGISSSRIKHNIPQVMSCVQQLPRT